MGPARKWNFRSSGSKIVVPVTSLGSKSGVIEHAAWVLFLDCLVQLDFPRIWPMLFFQTQDNPQVKRDRLPIAPMIIKSMT